MFLKGENATIQIGALVPPANGAALPKAGAAGEPDESDTANRRDDARASQPPLPVLRDLPHGPRHALRKCREEQPFYRKDETKRGKKIPHFPARPAPATDQLFVGGAGAAREAEGCGTEARPDGSLK